MLDIFTKRKALFFLLCCAISWQGCNIINPAEPVPTYVHIDSFAFQQCPGLTLYRFAANDTTDLTVYQPPTTHEITSVWVYYNENPIGIFDLPCTFPIIASGSKTLQISPVIAIDGQNNNLAVYPYYQPDTSTLVAQPGKTINYQPKTQYYPGAKITTIANFETGSPSGQAGFDLWQGNTGILPVSGAPFMAPSSWVGEIQLTAVGDSSIDSSKVQFRIPAGQTFIEFDYNSTVPFYVGLQAHYVGLVSTEPTFLSGINPSTGWRKFYLEVDGFAGGAQGTAGSEKVDYNFYIKAVLADGQTSGTLLIDNIQLVSF